MIKLMMFSSLILITCITSTKVLYRFGVPMLLIFIILGMLFGSDGVVGIYFDNYKFANELCSIGLVFIMFYGGFGTNWGIAKKVATPSILMSSLGVIITAGLVGLFCHLALNMTLLDGLLIGSVVASTDAASVFAILRAQKLNLKGSLASFLEIESGSNDPIAYMMTFIVLTMIKNGDTFNINSIFSIIFNQIVFGILVGFLFAKITVYILKRWHFEIEGFYTIFVMSVAILSYSFSSYIGGNGYLSVYISGIIIGNSKIPHKKSMFNFFDGISWTMQIILFFILGLLSFPSKLSLVSGISVSISIFMILFARPLAVFIILAPFKFTLKEKIFISFVGLRGAASVVFSIFVVTYGVDIDYDIFHLIFFIALLSVSLQGSLIPKLASCLDLVAIDESASVLKTFTDYTGEINTDLLEVNITKDSPWINKSIIDANIPEEILIVMIKRDNKILVPKGNTFIKENDILVLSGNNIEDIINNK